MSTIALLGSLFFGTAALAEDSLAGSLISCHPTRSDVANVRLENVRYGTTRTYAWASGTVRLVMKNSVQEVYSLLGRAVPLNRRLPRNGADAAFAYPSFRCVVNYPFITSVRNCRRSGSGRYCDVALRMGGDEYSYAISLTAKRR